MNYNWFAFRKLVNSDTFSVKFLMEQLFKPYNEKSPENCLFSKIIEMPITPVYKDIINSISDILQEHRKDHHSDYSDDESDAEKDVKTKKNI